LFRCAPEYVYDGPVNRWADHYTRKARDAGYPARSVFKLEEIQRRFEVLKRGGRVLDLGAASQANISFFTELGHKIYTEDLYPALNSSAYRVRDENRQWRFEPDAFLTENLSYQMLLFDAVLCWDLLDQLEENALRPVVYRLHRIVKPGGVLLSFFHTAEPGAAVPIYRYRIQGSDTLELIPRGRLTLRRPLNNRNIETLFKDFHSLKFFLARDNLREVLVIR